MTSNERLLKFLHRISMHFKLGEAEAVSFKKRNKLLEPLKAADAAAWQVMHGLIEAQLRLDRIVADKEKEQKNTAVWSAELEHAKATRESNFAALLQFFTSRGISLEGLPTEL